MHNPDEISWQPVAEIAGAARVKPGVSGLQTAAVVDAADARLLWGYVQGKIEGRAAQVVLVVPKFGSDTSKVVLGVTLDCSFFQRPSPSQMKGSYATRTILITQTRPGVSVACLIKSRLGGCRSWAWPRGNPLNTRLPSSLEGAIPSAHPSRAQQWRGQ